MHSSTFNLGAGFSWQPRKLSVPDLSCWASRDGKQEHDDGDRRDAVLSHWRKRNTRGTNMHGRGPPPQSEPARKIQPGLTRDDQKVGLPPATKQLRSPSNGQTPLSSKEMPFSMRSSDHVSRDATPSTAPHTSESNQQSSAGGTESDASHTFQDVCIDMVRDENNDGQLVDVVSPDGILLDELETNQLESAAQAEGRGVTGGSNSLGRQPGAATAGSNSLGRQPGATTGGSNSLGPQPGAATGGSNSLGPQPGAATGGVFKTA
eukprot:gene16218-22382_t